MQNQAVAVRALQSGLPGPPRTRFRVLLVFERPGSGSGQDGTMLVPSGTEMLSMLVCSGGGGSSHRI